MPRTAKTVKTYQSNLSFVINLKIIYREQEFDNDYLRVGANETWLERQHYRTEQYIYARSRETLEETETHVGLEITFSSKRVTVTNYLRVTFFDENFVFLSSLTEMFEQGDFENDFLLQMEELFEKQSEDELQDSNPYQYSDEADNRWQK